MSFIQGILGPAGNGNAVRIINEHPQGPRRCHLYPKYGQLYVPFYADIIYQKFSVKAEEFTHIHHLETNDRIPISRIGVMLPRGGTFVLKRTPLPRSRRSRLMWTSFLLVLLALAILAYNQTTFSEEWNSDVLTRTMGDRFRQGAAIALSLPLYFFPWDKIKSLESRYIKFIIIWGFGYFLHSIIVIYYVITIFWIEIPLPSVTVDNGLFFYSVAVTIVSIWLD